jgi:hypothetical protein
LILTTLALTILDDKFKDKIGEWKLIKLKSTKWIKKTKKDMSEYLLLQKSIQDGLENDLVFDFKGIEK